MKPYDVIVLGGGPAGYSCALRSLDRGMSVALVEADLLGGTCLHRGCVPTRAMLHAASLADAGTPADRWGIHLKVEGIDFERVIEARDLVVTRNHRAVEAHLRDGVDVIAGRGRLTGPREVLVGENRIQAGRAVVLATGSAPRTFPSMAPDGERILTSDHAMALHSVPRSAIILGGGAIGAEFSQIWRAFGAEVTVVERGPHLLPFEDPDVGTALERALRRRGIRSIVGARTREVTMDDRGVALHLRSGDRDVRLAAEVLLLAAGRDAALSDTGIEEVGVTVEDGAVVPGDWSTLETRAEGIYAVGDLLPPPSSARAHVAFAEGMLAADAIAGDRTRGIDYPNVPRITHGLIETACIGLTEDQARAERDNVTVDSMQFGGVAKGLILGEPGLTKVVAERDGPILGIHLVGPHASELAAQAATVVGFEATAAEAASVVHPHPTLSESLGELYLTMAGRALHHRPSA